MVGPTLYVVQEHSQPLGTGARCSRSPARFYEDQVLGDEESKGSIRGGVGMHADRVDDPGVRPLEDYVSAVLGWIATGWAGDPPSSHAVQVDCLARSTPTRAPQPVRMKRPAWDRPDVQVPDLTCGAIGGGHTDVRGRSLEHLIDQEEALPQAYFAGLIFRDVRIGRKEARTPDRPVEPVSGDVAIRRDLGPWLHQRHAPHGGCDCWHDRL